MADRALTLLATALCGRPVTLAAATGRRAAALDVDTVHLPQAWIDAPRQDWPATRLALLRQSVCCSPTHQAARAAAASRPLLLRVYSILESGQADLQVQRLFPGARGDLLRDRRQALAALTSPQPAAADVLSPDPAMRDAATAAMLSWRRRLRQLRLWMLGAPCAPNDVLAPHAQACLGDRVEPEDLLRRAHAIVAALDARPPGRPRRGEHQGSMPPTPALPMEVDGDGSAAAPPAGAPQGAVAGWLAGSGSAPLGAGTGGGSTVLGTVLPSVPAQPPDAGAQTLALESQPDALPANPLPSWVGRRRPHRPQPDGGAFAYDEWDFRAHRYRPAWALVHERQPAARDLDFLASLRRRHGRLTERIRRRIAHVRSLQRERLHRSRDGEEIDLEAAIEAHAERRAGIGDDGAVYVSQPPARRDVCAAFLLDVSGSTGFHLPARQAGLTMPPAEADEDAFFHAPPRRSLAPTPPRRRVIDVAHDAIGLMCDALAQLGDRHAVFGFSGEGRQQVDFHRAKDFDEPWSPLAAAALAALQPAGATRTGAALRHAVRQLARQPARTRFLILVTDGYPQDKDYGDGPDDIEYGLRDTAMALREAGRQGVSVFCVCIDHAAHDHLRRICPRARHMAIDEVDDLPQALTQVYRLLVREP